MLVVLPRLGLLLGPPGFFYGCPGINSKPVLTCEIRLPNVAHIVAPSWAALKHMLTRHYMEALPKRCPHLGSLVGSLKTYSHLPKHPFYPPPAHLPFLSL